MRNDLCSGLGLVTWLSFTICKMEIMITQKYIQCLLLAQLCAMPFTSITLFTAHNTSVDCLHFVKRGTDA